MSPIGRNSYVLLLLSLINNNKNSRQRKLEHSVRMVVSPLWRGPSNIHGFILDGKSYQQGKTTDQTQNVPAFSGVRKTTLLLCTCNLACGR